MTDNPEYSHKCEARYIPGASCQYPKCGCIVNAVDVVGQLITENWQLKGALGYAVPGDIPPSNEFKCGMCEARRQIEDGSNMNIVPLHKCVCGAAGSLRTVTWEDETITFFSCERCVDTTDQFLAQVRPIFEAMLACGVSGNIANNAMTYLLDQLPDTQLLKPTAR